MIDIQIIRNNPELVKENMKKKYQDDKLDLVDEVLELDVKFRKTKGQADDLRANRNKISKEIGNLYAQKKTGEAEEARKEVNQINDQLAQLEEDEKQLDAQITDRMMQIPQIMADNVPMGVDDTENVELEKFGEPIVPDYEIPHHIDIIESMEGINRDASRRISGAGFYFLQGDIARIHTAMFGYARDLMISKGFTYNIPPFLVRSEVVTGVMSFEEMENMMYKIEGEDLYMIGTSEHSMTAKFMDTITDEKDLPIKLTSYSPCFRKEVGAHGIEERGIYRVHQFEKQEMVAITKPEDSPKVYEEFWKATVEFFQDLDIPVRVLQICSGDMADLKVDSVDVEAWSPRRKEYFEVGSCSDLGSAQARRLNIRVRGEEGNYYPHTLNNTVVASPRGLIAFVENNLQEDGSIRIPEKLRPYLGGQEKVEAIKG